ncbi:MAG: ABC transporter ATP-binding protein [Bacteroidetes bacterium]|nr:ABC transporter ATP-binding protein [Bacteroidota bacterium]
MKNTNNISLKNATLGYKKSGKEISVLNHLNLDFTSSELIGIVGLNGTGKSTLLKTLCGLLPLLHGEIYIGAVDIEDLSLNELAKKISIVLTEKIGGFNLTAYDVVAAGQMPYTNSFNKLNAENISIIQNAIAVCGIAEHQHKLVNELSDGLFQKTVIAKALAQQTPIMLLDEPSAFLDYASKHDLFLLLQKLAAQQSKCILVSSHDLDLLLKYCQKLLVIAKGEAQLISVSEAKQNAAFMKIAGGFLG